MKQERADYLREIKKLQNLGKDFIERNNVLDKIKSILDESTQDKHNDEPAKTVQKEIYIVNANGALQLLQFNDDEDGSSYISTVNVKPEEVITDENHSGLFKIFIKSIHDHIFVDAREAIHQKTVAEIRSDIMKINEIEIGDSIELFKNRVYTFNETALNAIFKIDNALQNIIDEYDNSAMFDEFYMKIDGYNIKLYKKGKTIPVPKFSFVEIPDGTIDSLPIMNTLTKYKDSIYVAKTSANPVSIIYKHMSLADVIKKVDENEIDIKDIIIINVDTPFEFEFTVLENSDMYLIVEKR